MTINLGAIRERIAHPLKLVAICECGKEAGATEVPNDAADLLAVVDVQTEALLALEFTEPCDQTVSCVYCGAVDWGDDVKHGAMRDGRPCITNKALNAVGLDTQAKREAKRAALASHTSKEVT